MSTTIGRTPKNQTWRKRNQSSTFPTGFPNVFITFFRIFSHFFAFFQVHFQNTFFHIFPGSFSKRIFFTCSKHIFHIFSRCMFKHIFVTKMWKHVKNVKKCVLKMHLEKMWKNVFWKCTWKNAQKKCEKNAFWKCNWKKCEKMCFENVKKCEKMWKNVKMRKNGNKRQLKSSCFSAPFSIFFSRDRFFPGFLWNPMFNYRILNLNIRIPQKHIFIFNDSCQ